MDRFNLPEDKTLAKKILENQSKETELQLQLGFLGKLFGVVPNSTIYIVGIIALLLVISGLVYTFIPDSWKSYSTIEFWKTILPVITTLIGFLFGSHLKK